MDLVNGHARHGSERGAMAAVGYGAIQMHARLFAGVRYLTFEALEVSIQPGFVVDLFLVW